MILLAVSNTVEAKEVKYPNGDYYNGGWKKDKPHGKGKMMYNNGDIYEGEWAKGLMNGKGKMMYNNGAIYEGEWVEGLKRGKGTYTDFQNNSFDGYFDNGYLYMGKLICNNGKYCEGQFKHIKIDYKTLLSNSCELKNGTCVNYVQNKESFTGKILDGKYDEGKLIQPNGGWFEGKWKDGKIYNGTSSNFVQNKEYFTGKILNGKYDEGKLTQPNGGWVEGKWKEGRFYNGRSNGYIDSDFYDGIWTNGVFQGKCKLKFSNSKEGLKSFEGVIDESGTMDGTVEYVDNITYRGVLKNKKKEGHGTLFTSTREITMQGQWKDDYIIQGKGIYMYNKDTHPFSIDKSNNAYNIKIETDNGIITCEHKINLDKHSVYSKIAEVLLDLRRKQEEEEKEKKKKEDEEKKKKEELIALQKDFADAKYYYWTPSEILRLYQENPAKFDDTFYGSFLGDATLIRGKIANIRREIESGLFGDDIYYNIYLEGGVVIQTHKKSVVSQIQKGQTVFMLAKYKNQTTNKYGYTQSPIFRLVTDEFIANSIDAVSKYLKEKRDSGEKVYENYYFRNLVRNIYR